MIKAKVRLAWFTSHNTMSNTQTPFLARLLLYKTQNTLTQYEAFPLNHYKINMFINT